MDGAAGGLHLEVIILMEFRIADAFTDSLARLTGTEQKAVKTAAFDLQRQLLYVACTRARDHLLVTGVDPASEFIDDLLI